TIYKDDQLRVILFVFAAGQELSEHTSTHPAVLHFLQGTADVTLGEERHAAAAGTWVHMPPQLPHSIHAQTQVVMLLLMLPKPQARARELAPNTPPRAAQRLTGLT